MRLNILEKQKISERAKRKQDKVERVFWWTPKNYIISLNNTKKTATMTILTPTINKQKFQTDHQTLHPESPVQKAGTLSLKMNLKNSMMSSLIRIDTNNYINFARLILLSL